MNEITYRQCRRSDWKDIMNICYRTGFMGEDLTGMGRFNDRRLFGNLFCLYYIFYECENCFVAVDKKSDGKAVGYIIGTPDSKNYQKEFNKRMLWRIIGRLFLYTIWRYPGTYKEVMFWMKNIPLDRGIPVGDDYAAHLHIDILPEYQRMGIGTALISLFEEMLSSHGVSGVYLETSSRNYKSIPFYRKNGYNVLIEKKQVFWRWIDDVKAIVFAKKINPA